MNLICPRCALRAPPSACIRGCPACAADGVPTNWLVEHEVAAGLSPSDLDRPVADIADPFADDPRRNSMWRYAPLLEAPEGSIVSLGEGLTPLVDLSGLDLGPLSMKDESRNPTGSFKDRMASAVISRAGLVGARVVVGSSSGNGGAAIAAYAARAGLPCVVLVASDTNPAMVAQVAAYGAALLQVPGSPDRWTVMSAAVERLGWYPTTAYFAPPIGSNPLGVDGYRTIAYEIAESLGWTVPDWCAVPVCYGDAIIGIVQGFEDLLRLGWIDRVPRMLAAVVSGSLVQGLAKGGDRLPRCPRPRASIAHSIDAPQSSYQALAAVRRTGGIAISVDDDRIMAGRQRLARAGLLVEASSAITVPAVAIARADGRIGPDESVVAVGTSTGIKDLETQDVHRFVVPIAPTLDDALAGLRDRFGDRFER